MSRELYCPECGTEYWGSIADAQCGECNHIFREEEKNMALYCFTDVPEEGNKFRVAKIVENESGYYPLGKANPNDPHEIDKYVGDENHVRAVVDTMNKHLGVDKDREWEIKFSTMHVIK